MKLTGFSFAFFLLSSTLFADTMSYDYIEALSSIGPMQMWQSSDYVGADALILTTDREIKEFTDPDPAKCVDLATGLFNFVDYYFSPCPYVLARQHSRYFVSIYLEETINFNVVYYDQYSNPPSTGYPQITYWRDGTYDYVSSSMDYVGPKDMGLLFTKEVTLQRGTYWYKYFVKNDSYTDGYLLENSSFVVTGSPQNVANTGIEEGANVSNSKITFSWNASDPDGGKLNYKLYLGENPDNLALVYEGENPNIELKSLDYGKKYYWQIEAINIYGVSSKSPIYSFSTIQPVSKSFNYPNPFNPGRNQTTNIVFNMEQDGSAQLSIYTEMGDLCWQKSFDNLPTGANEITYDGRDDDGQMLYNGTYVCIIKKKYDNREQKEKCRILIIK